MKMRTILKVGALLTALLLGCERQPAPANSSSTPGQTSAPQTSTPPSSRTEVRQPRGPNDSEPEFKVGGSGISFEGIPGASADTTRNFLIILDQSGSMGEPLDRAEVAAFSAAGVSVQTRLDGAKWALAQFIGGAPADVNIGLSIFASNGLEELVPLGKENRDQLIAKVNGVATWPSGTPLGEAIKAGTDAMIAQFKKQFGYGEYRLIVVTDGEANGRVSVRDAAAYAERFGVPIYTIGFAVKGAHQLQQYSLWYRQAAGAKELSEALKETLVEEPELFDVVDPTDG